MKAINVTNYDGMLKMGMTLASGQWEENFMRDTSDKYGKYGKDMFVSDKQVAVLARISGIDPLIDMDAKPAAKPAAAKPAAAKPAAAKPAAVHPAADHPADDEIPF